MSPADPSGDPDISLVLRGDDDPAAARLKALQRAAIAGGGETADASDALGRTVIAAMAGSSPARLPVP